MSKKIIGLASRKVAAFLAGLVVGLVVGGVCGCSSLQPATKSQSMKYPPSEASRAAMP